MKLRLNIQSRVSEPGSSATAQKKPKKQTPAQAARTQPTATSTPAPAPTAAPEPAPTAEPSTGSTARTQQARTIAQEPSQENGSEEGQGSSGQQAPTGQQAPSSEFRKRMKNQLRNRIISPRVVAGDDHDEQEEMETGARKEVLEQQRRLTEMQIRLARIKKEKTANRMKRTKEDLAATMSNSLSMGLDQLEDEFDEEAARLRSEQQQREIELINLDDSTNQDEIDTLVAFSNEVIIDEDTDDEIIVDDEESMDHDANRTKRK